MVSVLKYGSDKDLVACYSRASEHLVFETMSCQQEIENCVLLVFTATFSTVPSGKPDSGKR